MQFLLLANILKVSSHFTYELTIILLQIKGNLSGVRDLHQL